MHAGLRLGTYAVIVLTIGSWATAAAQTAAPESSPQPAAEASCPPASDHLLVPPVGAAWLGSFEGVFDYPDRPDTAIWSIDEVLVGTIPVVDGQYTYPQPDCAAVLSGGNGNRFLVTTADPSSPTLDDTVMWQIHAGDYVSPMVADTGGASVYDVTSLAAARALVLSGDMPVGASAPPAPVCPLDAASPPVTGQPVSPGPDARAADGHAARTALATYRADIRAHRYHEAWDRLSPDARLHWGGFEGWLADGAGAGGRLGDTTDDPDTLCGWLTDADSSHDFGAADLTRAWLIEVTHAPVSDQSEEWIVAPLPDGTWSLWQVR